MGRRRYNIDEARIQKFLAEGRGQGMLADYDPWLHIQDVPSLGRSHRLFGIKTGRIHHLLSDGEWKVLLQLEYDAEVGEVKEQYPLDRTETLLIANELGFRHPMTTDGTPYVMTIDFLVIYRTSTSVRIRPLTFKYSVEQLTTRDHELLAIASGYWKRRNLELELIDETFIDEALVHNYASVRAFHDVSNIIGCTESLIVAVASDIGSRIQTTPSCALCDYSHDVAERLGSSPGTVFDVIRHLLARRFLCADLRCPTPLEQLPLSALSAGACLDQLR